MSKTSRSLLAVRVRKVLCALRHRSYRYGLAHGVVATTEHDDAGLGSEFGTVIDIGASRGQFALFASVKWPKARIICFEPLTRAAKRLRRTQKERVEVHEVALGAADGVQQ